MKDVDSTAIYVKSDIFLYIQVIIAGAFPRHGRCVLWHRLRSGAGTANGDATTTKRERFSLVATSAIVALGSACCIRFVVSSSSTRDDACLIRESPFEACASA